MALRHQVNTEPVASLQREDDESATETSGHDESPKEVPTTRHRKDTQLRGEMGNRHFREETTSSKEDTRETKNLG